MSKSYGTFKNFEIRDPVYFGKTPKDAPLVYDIVKWDEDKSEPRVCFSIGFLEWNERELCFEMKSVGLRFLKYREDGLEEWLLKWCAMMEYKLLHEDTK